MNDTTLSELREAQFYHGQKSAQYHRKWEAHKANGFTRAAAFALKQYRHHSLKFAWANQKLTMYLMSD